MSYLIKHSGTSGTHFHTFVVIKKVYTSIGSKSNHLNIFASRVEPDYLAHDALFPGFCRFVSRMFFRAWQVFVKRKNRKNNVGHMPSWGNSRILKFQKMIASIFAM